MRALPRILKERPHARVLIIGGNGVSYGAHPPAGQTWRDIFLSEVKDQLDLKRVHFIGKVDYPSYQACMQLSSVHVYLTYPFVLSWSLLEAMSMGCAIVASDTPPVQEVIKHGKTGQLVDFFDHDALAKQVITLLENPATRKKLGTAARKHVVKNYDLQTVCLPQQLAWVESLIKKQQ
jgi:glycosyltransferase involved in cell wall biosynthesis